MFPTFALCEKIKAAEIKTLTALVNRLVRRPQQINPSCKVFSYFWQLLVLNHADVAELIIS